jgi:hypothetical protein
MPDTTETLELLRQMRVARPFRPFIVRDKSGREVTVVRRMGFGANDAEGSASGIGGYLRFKTDEIKIIPMVPAEAV